MSPTMISLIGTIISALISGGVALMVANKQHDKSIALIEYRLKSLEDKVNKHNEIVERTYILETKMEMYHNGAHAK